MNEDVILHCLRYLPVDAVVIHGDARGADRMARDAALRLGLILIAFPADWEYYGKGAGPIRNRQMIEEGTPDFVLAFHDDLASSKGTRDMISLARVNHTAGAVIDDFGKMVLKWHWNRKV